jgi:lysine-N-methylase
MLENLRPQYAKQFRCIGAACEDACCSGWNVTIDRPTYQKYESLPAVHPRLKECFTVLSESEGRHARINLDPASRCPFFSPDSLCTIHRDFGESYLSETCTNYPRISRRIDGLIEKPLVLSCPEAARLVLLAPELLPGYRKRDGKRGYDRLLAISNSLTRRDLGAMRYVWEIRELCLLLLLDPVYDLWQRLFLLGMFCKKLADLIESGSVDQIPLLLHDYAQIAVDGRLRETMERVPVRLEAQVSMLLETVNSFFATRGPTQYRLHECLQDFLAACITLKRPRSKAAPAITPKDTPSTTALLWSAIPT